MTALAMCNQIDVRMSFFGRKKLSGRLPRRIADHNQSPWNITSVNHHLRRAGTAPNTSALLVSRKKQRNGRLADKIRDNLTGDNVIPLGVACATREDTITLNAGKKQSVRSRNDIRVSDKKVIMNTARRGSRIKPRAPGFVGFNSAVCAVILQPPPGNVKTAIQFRNIAALASNA